jgi:hypothetical protein
MESMLSEQLASPKPLQRLHTPPTQIAASEPQLNRLVQFLATHEGVVSAVKTTEALHRRTSTATPNL